MMYKAVNNDYQEMVEVRDQETCKLLGFLESWAIKDDDNPVIEIILPDKETGWSGNPKTDCSRLTTVTMGIVKLEVMRMYWSDKQITQLKCTREDWERLLEADKQVKTGEDND